LNLNDPFGRNARRQSRRYEQFREQLLAQGVNAPERLDGFVTRINAMTRNVAAIAIGALLLIWLLFPTAGAAALVVCGLLLAWLAANYVQTRGFAARLRQELAQRPQDEPAPENDTGAKPEEETR
jgi:hypothetical protein